MESPPRSATSGPKGCRDWWCCRSCRGLIRAGLPDKKESLTVVGYRDELAWRGVGVGFRSEEWLVMRRKAKGRAMWLRMRRKKDHMEVWVGAVHLGQGLSCRDHTREIEEAMDILPATTLPCVLGCDGNAALRWVEGPQGHVVPYGEDLKADNMLGTLSERGFRVVGPPPEQFHAPTSRPRREGSVGHQIDFLAVKHAHMPAVHIHVDSFKSIDGDHDFVSGRLTTEHARRRVKRVDTRPRRVTEQIPTQTVLDQTTMVQLAEQYTQPRQSRGYRDPPDVKVLFQMAKHGGQKSDWKQAQAARRRARAKWAQAQLDRAVEGDWKEIRRLRPGQHRHWEATFACNMAEQNREPHRAIHEHLAGIFQAGPDVSDLVDVEVTESPEVTDEEILVGVGKAKGGKAVGVDLTSKELLAAMVDNPVTLRALGTWFSDILKTGEVPEDWGKAIMVVIPKTSYPQTVKDVRPIAMGSAVGKLFSRILLNRAMGIMKHETAIQCAGSGRQTSDYLYSIAKSFDLEREWKSGTVWAKIDISKAFDTLDRRKFLQRLKSRMGCTQEFRCWTRMFLRNPQPWADLESRSHFGADLVQGKGFYFLHIHAKAAFSTQIVHVWLCGAPCEEKHKRQEKTICNRIRIIHVLDSNFRQIQPEVLACFVYVACRM